MPIQQKLPPPALLFSDFAGLDSAGGGVHVTVSTFFSLKRKRQKTWPISHLAPYKISTSNHMLDAIIVKVRQDG